ncbi:hypothetical protein [Vibrio sp. Vb1980]|uniref:hypothetical protein n=1 Tax=Vibrio sp. Vb1980 TaxID=3074646 RepID=UPI002964A152|nr:hypothetical protein [Vibrio sp. Vb1980]MDW1974593.1 hypothetical protein [Vibrio sp. Vb1980]
MNLLIKIIQEIRNEGGFSSCNELKGMSFEKLKELVISYGNAKFVSYDGICLYIDNDISIEISYLSSILKKGILSGKTFDLYVVNGNNVLVSDDKDKDYEPIKLAPGSTLSYSSYSKKWRLMYESRVLCLVVNKLKSCESDIEDLGNSLSYIDFNKDTSRIKNIVSLSEHYPDVFINHTNYFLKHCDHSVRLQYMINYLNGVYGLIEDRVLTSFLNDESDIIKNIMKGVIYDNNK